MAELKLSMVEPFTSPAWGSNMVVFSSVNGIPIKEEDTRDYLAKASKYAVRHKVYLVTERFIMLGVKGISLINPLGKVVGAQQELNSSCGNSPQPNKEVNVVKTPFGEMFLCIDNDIYSPELTRVAYNQGAKIIVASQYIPPDEQEHYKIIAGVWNAAQSNNLFAIGVSNQFHTVCAPKALTRHNDGFYMAPTSKRPAIAQFYTDELADLPLRPSLSRRFYLLHKKELIGRADT